MGTMYEHGLTGNRMDMEFIKIIEDLNILDHSINAYFQASENSLLMMKVII